MGSYKQVQIFGLISKPRPPRLHFPYPEFTAARPPQPDPQFWGTVKAVNGSHVTIELRSGKELQVDTGPATEKGRAIETQVGMFVAVHGKLNTDGSLAADTVVRAKGKALWGTDREK